MCCAAGYGGDLTAQRLGHHHPSDAVRRRDNAVPGVVVQGLWHSAEGIDAFVRRGAMQTSKTLYDTRLLRCARNMPLTAVLDTNVFVRALISETSWAARVFDAFLAGQFSLATSESILDEVRRTL